MSTPAALQTLPRKKLDRIEEHGEQLIVYSNLKYKLCSNTNIRVLVLTSSMSNVPLVSVKGNRRNIQYFQRNFHLVLNMFCSVEFKNSVAETLRGLLSYILKNRTTYKIPFFRPLALPQAHMFIYFKIYM